MWNRQRILVAGLVACACLAIQATSRLPAQQESSAGKSETESDQENVKKQERELDVRYAKAYLQLTQVTLDKYQDLDRSHPGTIPPNVMRVIQEGVREARDRVQLVGTTNSGDAEIYVSGAESELHAAEESLREAESANAASSAAESALQVELHKAKVELAKIRVEKARHLAGESPLSNVRFELGQLREEVQQLRMFVALLRENY
jgi:hypothetical protein